MDYTKEQCKKLYEEYKLLESETMLQGGDINTSTGDIVTSRVDPQKILEKHEIAKKLNDHCQLFLVDLSQDERTNIINDAN